MAKSKIIQTLHDGVKPIAEIARITRRSRCAVRNVIRDRQNYWKKMSAGRPRAVSPRSERRIISIQFYANRTVNRVDTAIRNVRNITARAKHLKRRKLQRKPPLTEKHKLAKMAFVENHLRLEKKWRRVIFTDEKNLTFTVSAIISMI